MKRREFLRSVGVGAVGLWGAAGLLGAGTKAYGAADPSAPGAEKSSSPRKPKVLYFTRSVGFEHSVVKTGPDGQSFSDKILQKLGQQHGFDLLSTKDGRVFDGDLDQFDLFCFYHCNDPTTPESIDKAPPMTQEGMKKLLAAVEAGKPVVGLHSACYMGPRKPGQPLHPFLAMLGGEFISHGEQQKSTLRVVSPKFPGMAGLPEKMTMIEEWYALHCFAPDLHVILVQETEGMKGPMYQRPPFPATWARMHGKGRVFYTSLGHREDVWESKEFQSILIGGILWALGRAEADICPNLRTVAPQAEPPKTS